MDREFWKDKKVFITGHTGFKGAWLSLWLQNCGASLTGYALKPNTNPNLFDVAEVESGMKSIIGDIRDLEKLTKILIESSPDIVIHMAAQPLVRESYKNPVDTYNINVLGTVNLFEAIRKSPSVKVVINVTSDKCYENREWAWGYREYEPMGGHDPYSNSKGCSELVTSAYRSSYFYDSNSSNVASCRSGNVIGGGDWAKDRLIPDVFKSFEKNKPIQIRNPLAIRPWQHVLEPLSGYLVLAEKLFYNGSEFAESWNFGPEDENVKQVKFIIEYLAEKWGSHVSWFHDESNQPHEAQLLKLDISKAKSKLDWSPKWNLLKTLDSIIEWQKAWLNTENVKELTLRQIEEFEKN